MLTVTPGTIIRCDECHVAALRVQNGMLVIQHVHHGQKHTTILPIQDLLDKIEAASVP